MKNYIVDKLTFRREVKEKHLKRMKQTHFAVTQRELYEYKEILKVGRVPSEERNPTKVKISHLERSRKVSKLLVTSRLRSI